MGFVYNDREHVVLYQGDALNIRVPVEDQDGNPVDISSATIDYAIASSTDSTPDVSLSVGSGIAVNNPNQFTIALSGADTALLNGSYYPELDASLVQRPTRKAIENSYYHECRVTSSSGEPHVVFSGRVFVRTSLIEGQV